MTLFGVFWRYLASFGVIWHHMTLYLNAHDVIWFYAVICLALYDVLYLNNVIWLHSHDVIHIYDVIRIYAYPYLWILTLLNTTGRSPNTCGGCCQECYVQGDQIVRIFAIVRLFTLGSFWQLKKVSHIC
jgi:hypothetical protein